MKQIKKILIALVLVLGLFLVACGETECPECKECPEPECNVSEVCQGLIDPATCPETECPSFDADKECQAAGWTKECPEVVCPECPEGITAPESVEFYSEDIAVGAEVKFETEISPAKAYAGLVWFTSDPSIATVAEDGTITGVKPGKVTITVKSALNAEVKYAEEVEVVEKGLLDYEIAEREKNAIVAALSQGYVTADFDLPTTWNASAKVTYSDPNGKEITKFTMPDLGEATSQNYAISGSVTYKDSVSEFNVTLKLVKAAEGKNDYEKVIFATEVAEAFLYEYLQGAKVEADVFLPTSVYGVALNWSTDKAYVLDAAGKLAKPNNDTTVTYTITPKLGAASASKTYKVTVAGYGEDDKIEFLLKKGALANIAGKAFTGSIPLPELDPQFGIKLAYVSSNPKLIANDGTIDAHAYDTEEQKVTFTVTAIYDDKNSPADAFTKVFTFDVKVAALAGATQDVVDFAKAHPQFAHIAYGDANFNTTTGKQYVIAPTEFTTLEGWTFVGDENFKVNTDSVTLETQYFRYHVAHLTATKGGVSYTWAINIGIGAETGIIYIGGRSQSYQASANPNERADSLQGFSNWDKYVGVVANNTERTVQQYWSEFSGYTAYVDIPTGAKEVIYTLDAEGNVTIYPTDKDAHVRQQMFFMEFAVLRITNDSIQEYFGADKKTKVYVPYLANKDTVRQTYGGNFGSLYVNESDKDIDIPVSALSMGGTFSDGEAMKTFTKSAITLYKIKSDGKIGDEFTLVDDYGSNTSVKREQSWAYDGYRPAFVAQPKAALVGGLKEGQIDKEYEFTVGIQAALESSSASNYIQYAISSKLSNLWQVPYVVLPKQGGMSFAWHSQTAYSFSGFGGGYISGQDMSLPIYFSRYYRHALNEELTDGLVGQIKNYYIALTGVAGADYDAGKIYADKVVFDDLSVDELNKIVDFDTKLNAFPVWYGEKAAVKNAKDAIKAIALAAKTELANQLEYAKLTKKLFDNVKDEYAAKKTEDLSVVKTFVESAGFVALLQTAKRNYDSLTAGQKGLYDKGYNKTIGDITLEFTAQDTAWIEESINLVADIDALSVKLTDANVAQYDAAAKRLKALKDASKDELINNKAAHKMSLLALVKSIKDTKPTTSDVEAAKLAIANLASPSKYPTYTYTAAEAPFKTNGLYFTKDGDVYTVVANPVESELSSYYTTDFIMTGSDDQLFVAGSFNDVKNEDKTVTWGLDAFFNGLLAQEAAKKAADLATAKAATISNANVIKTNVPTLPAAKEVKNDGLGALQGAYDNTVKALKALLAGYKTLEVITATYTDADLVAKKDEIKAILVGGAYAKTTDTALDDAKTYYTLGDADPTTGYKAATKVAEPDVANIGTYYEFDATIGALNGKDEGELLDELALLPAAIDTYKASVVEDQIDALPAKKNVTTADEAAVKAADDAYKALTAAQKALVTNYADINELKTAIDDLKVRADVDPVEDLIDALPASTKLVLADETAVNNAKKAFDALSDANKDKVDAVLKNELNACVNAMTALITEAVQADAAYKAAKAAFEANTLDGAISAATLDASKALVEVYNALTGHAKAAFDTEVPAAKLLVAKIAAAIAAYESYTK